jgi:hypothetical protein
MTPEFSNLVASCEAAEPAGDAEAALEFHRGVPMFARGRHLSILTQLAGLTAELTPWMWARWAAYQCTRAEDRGTATGEIQRSALDYTVRMFYADRIEEAYLTGGDPVQVLAHVAGESWLYRQLCTYELGGLESFVDELATATLASHGGLARSWASSWMGAYRVLQRDGRSLVVRDLQGDGVLTLLDLGAALPAEDGWLLGRVVSSGTTPELMFDTRPIAVDEQTAAEVAFSPKRGGWVSAVKAALVEGRLEWSLFDSEDLELASDVPGLLLLEAGTPPAALASAREQLGRGRDEIGRAAFRILSRVAGDTFGGDELAPYVAAAVLNPHGYDEALRALAGSGEVEAWSRWAALTPEPARSRLLRLAGFAAAA